MTAKPRGVISTSGPSSVSLYDLLSVAAPSAAAAGETRITRQIETFDEERAEHHDDPRA
jgi:hypothetical protein